MLLPLKVRVTAIEEHALRKLVRLEWFVTKRDNSEVVLLGDQLSMDAEATDEEIRVAIMNRRKTVEPQLDRREPDAEMNKDLIGAVLEIEDADSEVRGGD